MPGRALARRAFTILELLVVLLVLSLCAATTVRFYFSRSQVTLENAAILLAHDLRAAQHRAIFLNEPSHFRFLPDGSGYVVTDTRGNLSRNPQTDEPFLRSYPEDGVFHGVTILDVTAGDDRVLEIDPHGAPLENLSVTLGFGDERRTLVMSSRTGVITLVGSTSDWVDREP